MEKLQVDFARGGVFAADADQPLLYTSTTTWACADGPLTLSVVSQEPATWPDGEGSEPRAAALARVNQMVRLPDALVLIHAPAELVAEAHVAMLAGCRGVILQSTADEIRWDQALAAGLPLYALGQRGAILSERPTPSAALMALAYGQAIGGDAELIAELDEHRRGIRWQLSEPAAVRVVVRGGFEAADHPAGDLAGAYQDHGTEGTVRVIVEHADGRRCWTQPRMVMPLPSGGGGCG